MVPALMENHTHTERAWFQKLAFLFEPNQGQAPAGVRYVFHDGAAEAALRPNGFDLILPAIKRQFSWLSIEFADANRTPSIAALSPLPGKSNYLLGNDPSR
jgi:hypothetical protein